QVGRVGERAPVMRGVVGRAERPERDAPAEERTETLDGLGTVAPHPFAVRQRDLRGRDAAVRGLLGVPRRTEEELRELLRAPDLARRLVADGPAAIARDPPGAELAPRQAFAAHRLDRIPPDLRDAADDHGAL